MSGCGGTGEAVNSNQPGSAERRPHLRITTRLTLAGALLLCGLVGGSAAAGPAPNSLPNRPWIQAAGEIEATPAATCASGRLLIGDLPAIQEEFEESVAAETARALEWQADARLVGLRVGCELLGSGFNWRGAFFSDAIQTYFFSDTGETRTVDAVAPPGPTLDLSGVSFVHLHRSLIRAGYDEMVELNPSSNVELRLNSEEAPFGPPEAPRDEVYFHVAVETRGEVVDLFVSAESGTLYQYRL